MFLRAEFTIAVAVMLAAPVSLFAQSESQKFPYRAFVKNDGALVYSGPGSVHYETEALTIDSTVEVYRHDPGGWCAIRPTPESFSLIPASAVEKIQDDVGQVNDDGIQVWVGTRLGAVENPLWQVKLKKEELVNILGEANWPNPEGHSTVWYQIAPPAGEYRWIRLSDLKPPKQNSKLPTENQNGMANKADSMFTRGDDSSYVAQASYDQSDPIFEDSLDPPSERDATVNRGWKKAQSPIRIADRRTDSNPIEPFKIPAIDSPSNANTGSTPLTNQPSRAPRKELVSNDLGTSYSAEFVPLDPITGQVSNRMTQLETALTKEMLESPDRWKLEPILKQATQISTQSSNVTERQHAVRLIAKIRQCVSIQSKFESAYKGNRIDQSLSGIVGTGIGSSTADNQVQLGTTYDAHGWLNKLVRGKGSLDPTYVIENDKGEIVFHVAPAPGVNLNRYLKNKVGIIGRRGFHRTLNMNHVTADRVVVLDSIRR